MRRPHDSGNTPLVPECLLTEDTRRSPSPPYTVQEDPHTYTSSICVCSACSEQVNEQCASYFAPVTSALMIAQIWTSTVIRDQPKDHYEWSPGHFYLRLRRKYRQPSPLMSSLQQVHWCTIDCLSRHHIEAKTNPHIRSQEPSAKNGMFDGAKLICVYLHSSAFTHARK